MSTLTPPKSNIPIGVVELNGKRIQVLASTEWLRYWSQQLYERAGGATGSGTTDLSTSAFEDAGIDDSKVTVERLADEMRIAPLPIAPVQDSSDNLANLIAELDSLRRRIEALEVS